MKGTSLSLVFAKNNLRGIQNRATMRSFATVLHPKSGEVYPIPDRVRKGSHIASLDHYNELYKSSVSNSDVFWGQAAKDNLSWFQSFTEVHQGTFTDGDVAWFLNGKINVAILWEGDRPDQIRKITYKQLQQEVSKLANAMLAEGLKKGDTIAIYLPNIPEAAIAMLACARIGVLHSLVFAGFSAEALAARIQDASAKLLITADFGFRGGKQVPLKAVADEALSRCPDLKRVFVVKRGEAEPKMTKGRDVYMHDVTASQRAYCPPVPMDSEDPLFLLYTSGSTGKPKGVMHTQAGYLLHASLSHKYVFDHREGDVYACVADVGWITGHTYIVYGPLCNGATTFMFEGVPNFPDAGRYWDMVHRHKITQLYTAPTAIRSLMKHGDTHAAKYDRSSLRVLGSVGEPINPEAWKWYHSVVGDEKCAIVDTYWQTESGGHMLSPIPGAIATKPGSGTVPFLGMDLVVLDPTTGKRLEGNNVRGVLAVAKPWPGLARTVYNDHARYLDVYMKVYPGYYFTGDSVWRDEDGYYWIQGRVDDVINVSGHRIGTAEVESALAEHKGVAEAAVVGAPDEVKGQAIVAFVIPKEGVDESSAFEKELRDFVRKSIGPFASPEIIIFTHSLPKVRSGKIMRRLLRKIAANETDPAQLGDVSALAEPQVVDELIKKMGDKKKPKPKL